MGCAPLSHMYCGRHRGIQNAQREREVGVSRPLRRSDALGHRALPQYRASDYAAYRVRAASGGSAGWGNAQLASCHGRGELRHAKRAA